MSSKGPCCFALFGRKRKKPVGPHAASEKCGLAASEKTGEGREGRAPTAHFTWFSLMRTVLLRPLSFGFSSASVALLRSMASRRTLATNFCSGFFLMMAAHPSFRFFGAFRFGQFFASFIISVNFGLDDLFLGVGVRSGSLPFFFRCWAYALQLLCWRAGGQVGWL